MILNVYNTRDELAGQFGTPIFTIFNDQQMIENYKKTCDDLVIKFQRMLEIDPNKAYEFLMQASQLRDCVIYSVGTFDSDTGMLSFSANTDLVCRIGDFFPKDFLEKLKVVPDVQQQAN